jgi:DNA-binding beta-propeller fold protein YncE
VTVIREGAVIKSIPVGFTPFGITSSLDGRYVFVTSLQTNVLTVIRTSDNSITELIPLRDESTGIAASQSGNYVYVVNENEGTVSVVAYSDGSDFN